MTPFNTIFWELDLSFILPLWLIIFSITITSSFFNYFLLFFMESWLIPSPFILVLEGLKITIFSLCLGLALCGSFFSCSCFSFLGTRPWKCFGLFSFIRDSFSFPKQFKHWLRSTRMGLLSRLGEGHFKDFPNLIGTLCSEPLFWKCYRSFFDFGELLKCIGHSLSIVISSKSWFLEPLPHGLVGFQPRSQGLVGSFVPFNPFSLGNSIICGRFPGKPFLGSPSWWAGLIWEPPSLHPFIGSFYTLFKVFFPSFFYCWAFGLHLHDFSSFLQRCVIEPWDLYTYARPMAWFFFLGWAYSSNFLGIKKFQFFH